MAVSGVVQSILSNLPEVAKPTQRKLGFNEKLKWTLIVLLLFFLLGLIPLFGLGTNSLQRFEILSIILGAEFGSIISLGIGPIVTASIVLQLLNGSGLVKFDLTTTEGKSLFQGTQKALAIFFIIFEAFIYVSTGGLSPVPGVSTMILIFQLFLGGMLIMFMDEVVSKWGFGSGLSLFIAAGVSKEIMVRFLSPLTSSKQLFFVSGESPVGALWSIIYFIPQGINKDVLVAFFSIVATIAVFVIAVYAQSLKVEIPLSFGVVRGHGIRWPLSFVYTSNIPVILIAALLASVQLWARLLERAGHPILGTFAGNTPATGIVSWISAPRLLQQIIEQGSLLIGARPYLQALVYVTVMIAGAVIFSIFWVQTAGMDAGSQARQIMASGLLIPGFRRDERVLEHLLNRYINPLTVMGAITVGLLAALADLSGALSHGTGILLTVMIIYRLYEEIAQQHVMDMNPLMRRFMK